MTTKYWLCSLLSLFTVVYGQFRLTEMYTYGSGGGNSGYGSVAAPYSQQYNYPYTNYYSSNYGGPAYSGAYYNDPFYYTNNYRPGQYNLPAYAPYYQPSGLFGLWGTRRKGHSDRFHFSQRAVETLVGSKMSEIVRNGIRYAPYLSSSRKMEKNEEDLQMKRNLILQELERMDGGGVGRGLWNDNDSKIEDGQIDSPVVRAEISNGCPYKRSRLSEDNRDNEERTSQTESPYSHSNGYEDSDRDESPNGEEMDSIENELENNLDEKPVFKTVLEEVDNDPFLSLPAGWRRLTHNSGLHLYLHGKERVVTFSRPYFIGPDSVRNHAVPVSAIPCLQQKRKKKLVEEQKQEECISHENPMIASIQSKKPTIETYEDSQLNPTSLTEYCDGLFSFKQIRVRKYQNFKEKKLEKQALKTDQMLRDAGASIEDLKDDEMATVTSSGVALINIPTQDKRFHKKTFVMNPTGKTSIQILHEYVQRALKGRLECMEKDTANTTQPYSATYKLHLKKAIRIQLASGITEKLEILHSKGDDVEGEDVLVLGTGYGSRKKNAKLEAAEKAVNLLIPSITFDQEHIASLQTNGPQVNYNVKATEIFDKIEVTDKRVFDLCNRSGVAAPYRCLKEACQRRGELQGEEPQITSFPAGDRQTEVVLTLRDITVSAKANGAKIAKQYAAQQLLQKLHPLVQHYGTILRMYDSAQEKHLRKENSRNHDEVISLQNKGSKAEPNKAIVEKLRAEMMAIPRGDISRRIGAKRASPSVNPY